MSGFEQFIQERTYLQNVSPRTVNWYRQHSSGWKNSPDRTEICKPHDRRPDPDAAEGERLAIRMIKAKWPASAMRLTSGDGE